MSPNDPTATSARVHGLASETTPTRALAYAERAKEAVHLGVTFRDVQNVDDETRRNMTQAFEAACDRLKLDLDDPIRGKLAREIIALVSIGERDPARLFALAIAAIDSEESDDGPPI